MRPRSLVQLDGLALAMSDDWRLVAQGEGLEDLEGERSTHDGDPIVIAPATHANLEWLRARLPWLRPGVLGTACSAGFGDRLGLATAGHIRALRAAGRGIAPIFAQQSIREMTRSRRTPREVLDDATWGVFAEGWRHGFAADADHLKTEADVDACAAAGYTFYTIDPGEHVWDLADSAPAAEVERAVAALPRDLRPAPASEAAMRAAAKYGRAVAQVARLDARLRSLVVGPYELEVSVDETATATTPAQHRYIATALHGLEVDFVSLAPRFPGRFEKGVDYIGDLAEFEQQFGEHARIARELGPYKLSLHSGSDKFSIYEAAARLAGRVVHLKTAGTSWLEALATVGTADPELLAEIYGYALERYPADRASYQVSAEVGSAPSVADLADDAVRQILHVTFGSLMERFGDRILAVLVAGRDAYESRLERHFSRHLAPFQA